MRVGVHGATGRMGRLVLDEIERAPDLDLAWACGRTLPVSLACDVVVDFSTPDGLVTLLAHARSPVVSGTTGRPPPRVEHLAFLHAANFSLGVAVLARLVAMAHAALPAFDAEIVELHHTAKRDAPSGTALRLAAGLGEVRNGNHGPRPEGGVGIHAVRAGDAFGEHTVYLAGPGERLELKHVATQRSVFARGALHAARWLRGQPPGTYRFEDCLPVVGPPS